MLSDRDKCADQSDADAEQNADRHKVSKYGVYTQKHALQILQNTETADELAHNTVIRKIQNDERQDRSDQAQDKAFSTNGIRTKASVAPISFIRAISFFRTEIPTLMVLLIRIVATIRRITIMPTET